MAKVLTPSIARIERIGPEKLGDHGSYRSVLLKDQNGVEIWLSFDANSPDLKKIREGAMVSLVCTGHYKDKPVYAILDGEIDRVAIAAHVDNLGKLYGYCLKIARQHLPEEAPGTVDAAAGAIFARTTQRYGL